MITRVHAFDSNGQASAWLADRDRGRRHRADGPGRPDADREAVRRRRLRARRASRPCFSRSSMRMASLGSGQRCRSHAASTRGPSGLTGSVRNDSPLRDVATSVNTDIEDFGTDGRGRAGRPRSTATSRARLRRQGRALCVSPSAPRTRSPARTLVLDRDWPTLPLGSNELAHRRRRVHWRGAGPDYPGAPIVAGDGTAFIVSSAYAMTDVIALDPSGQRVAGWPYHSDLGLQETGSCPPGDTGCGGYRAAPAIGPGNILHLVHARPSDSGGGSVVAIGPRWPRDRWLAGHPDATGLGVLVSRGWGRRHRICDGDRARAERQPLGNDPRDRPGQRHPLQRDDRRAVGVGQASPRTASNRNPTRTIAPSA